jgi:hypothetical protein
MNYIEARQRVFDFISTQLGVENWEAVENTYQPPLEVDSVLYPGRVGFEEPAKLIETRVDKSIYALNYHILWYFPGTLKYHEVPYRLLENDVARTLYRAFCNMKFLTVAPTPLVRVLERENSSGWRVQATLSFRAALDNDFIDSGINPAPDSTLRNLTSIDLGLWRQYLDDDILDKRILIQE